MKQFTPVVKKIGDNTFYIRPFPAFTAANMTGDLANIATPALAAIAPLALKVKDKKVTDLMDADISEVAPALSGAFAGLSGDELERLCKKLLTDHQTISVSQEGGEAKLLTEDLANEIFCGDTQDMFILMWQVVSINFNGFFKKLAARFGLDGELFKKLQTTQNTAPLT